MKRTTIMLTDSLDTRLRHEARRRGVSIADVARRAIEQKLPEPAPNGALSFFALGTGEPHTIRLSARAAKAFDEALQRPAQANQRLADALSRPRKFTWLD